MKGRRSTSEARLDEVLLGRLGMNENNMASPVFAQLDSCAGTVGDDIERITALAFKKLLKLSSRPESCTLVVVDSLTSLFSGFLLEAQAVSCTSISILSKMSISFLLVILSFSFSQWKAPAFPPGPGLAACQMQ
jgi:hypothetical protein